MLHIVCVDDNYLFLTSLGAELRKQGYSLTLTTNPKTALLEICVAQRISNPVDVLIADFHLPGYFDTTELCDRVYLEFPSTNIIILTADRDITLDHFTNHKPNLILYKLSNYLRPLIISLKKFAQCTNQPPNSFSKMNGEYQIPS